jgi:GAF domain-containing protein
MSVAYPQAARGWQIDEKARAAGLGSYDLAALRDTPELRAITDFAGTLCVTPIALISLVEEARQTFIARTGLEVTETPRETSFCAHAMLGDAIMEVPDATADPRFADNALVTGEPRIRFYAGAPLINEDGVPLGALCVIDTVPRPSGLTPAQRQGLIVLAANVMARLRDTRDAAAWRHAERDAKRALHDSRRWCGRLCPTAITIITMPAGMPSPACRRDRPMARRGTACSIPTTRSAPGACGASR